MKNISNSNNFDIENANEINDYKVTVRKFTIISGESLNVFLCYAKCEDNIIENIKIIEDLFAAKKSLYFEGQIICPVCNEILDYKYYDSGYLDGCCRTENCLNWKE
ncbi:hypothetical protein KA977_02355 [Candidatus Dependentiae bacterium]|nr:hypothetical protein [Candidatus Dependentiae bacterium]